MVEPIPASWFIGCACDRNYVAHTATMLASLDINGDVPEAAILVAAFGLNDDDRAILYAGAGKSASNLSIIDVDDEVLQSFDQSVWTAEYPPAVIGRLFLCDRIQKRGARLLTIDSDTIVNVSLRPLFSTRLFGSYIAACHDVPRHDDPDYFNSGIMLIDVDGYKKFDVAHRSLRWLASQQHRVIFPDQDALNEIVGHVWHRLDHRWNFHCNYGEERAVTPNDYERSYIAHFAANKPWNDPTHPGLPLYQRYRDELDRRIVFEKRLSNSADATFVAAAMEVFLGRSATGTQELEELARTGAKNIITSIVKSEEFLGEVLTPIIMGQDISPSRFSGAPEEHHLVWAAQRLNLGAATKVKAMACTGWLELLHSILADDKFRSWSANVYLLRFADLIKARHDILGQNVA